MKKKLTVLFSILMVGTLAYAGTVSQKPYGIAFPYWYGYSNGAKSTYYLEHPTLTANDQVVSEDATQTLTNKTLTNPTVASIKDASGNIVHSSGTSIPAATTSGYSIGSEFILTNASLGQSPKWINQGSATSCLFVPIGPVMGYGFAWAGGPVDCVNGAAATSYEINNTLRNTDLCFAGHEVSDDNDQIIGVEYLSGHEKLTITGSADPLTAHDYVYAGLRNKCAPEFDIFAAGSYDAVAGDDATIAISVTGVLAGDIAFAYFSDTDDTDTIASVKCTAGVVTITENADPVTDHSYFYVVLRARGTFKPSHYVAYAGQHTCAGGDAVEAATVTGLLATDIIISVIGDATCSAANILKVVPTANTITWTFNADPTVGHAITYAALRAY